MICDCSHPQDYVSEERLHHEMHLSKDVMDLPLLAFAFSSVSTLLPSYTTTSPHPPTIAAVSTEQ